MECFVLGTSVGILNGIVLGKLEGSFDGISLEEIEDKNEGPIIIIGDNVDELGKKLLDTSDGSFDSILIVVLVDEILGVIEGKVLDSTEGTTEGMPLSTPIGLDVCKI